MTHWLNWAAAAFSFLKNVFFLLLVQIQNADDVLISPLEKFRKEQIGAVKVRLQLDVMVAVTHWQAVTKVDYNPFTMKSLLFRDLID